MIEQERKKILYKLRKEKLRARMPLVVLIIICFLIYNLWIPLEFIKWLSVAILVFYLGMGFHFQKKLKNELDKIDQKVPEPPPEDDL